MIMLKRWTDDNVEEMDKPKSCIILLQTDNVTAINCALHSFIWCYLCTKIIYSCMCEESTEKQDLGRSLYPPSTYA